MEITYDEPKRLINIAKHGFDFAVLDVAFFASSVIVPAKASRYMAIGEFRGQTIVAVVFAPLGSEAISVISMRAASRKERNIL
ncbi:MAG TPA: BrnT family toxin [Devosia sp.]|nr:BrnT family toxin [Devosia sp.]